jgi:hypothetical protein
MTLTTRSSNFRSRISTAILLAAGYFVLVKLGLRLAIVHPSATAVWPPSGIALAATLLLAYLGLARNCSGRFRRKSDNDWVNPHADLIARMWIVSGITGGHREFAFRITSTQCFCASTALQSAVLR